MQSYRLPSNILKTFIFAALSVTKSRWVLSKCCLCVHNGPSINSQRALVLAIVSIFPCLLCLYLCGFVYLPILLTSSFLLHFDLVLRIKGKTFSKDFSAACVRKLFGIRTYKMLELCNFKTSNNKCLQSTLYSRKR